MRSISFPLGLEVRIGVEPRLVDDQRALGEIGRIDEVRDGLALLCLDQGMGGAIALGVWIAESVASKMPDLILSTVIALRPKSRWRRPA